MFINQSEISEDIYGDEKTNITYELKLAPKHPIHVEEK
jgi:hypothetical protein